MNAFGSTEEIQQSLNTTSRQLANNAAVFSDLGAEFTPPQTSPCIQI